MSQTSKNALYSTVEDDGSVFFVEEGRTRSIHPGELVYPCGKMETFYGKILEHITVQTIWLEFVESITVEDVRLALQIVSRQVPHLQFCLAKSGNKFWFRRIKDFKIDFDMCSKDALEMHNEMLETKVDLWNGPLWKIRLNLNHNSESIVFTGGRTAYLTLCVHHAITDATSNMKICRDLVTILNRMKSGQHVKAKLVPLSPTTDELRTDQNYRIYFAKHYCRKSLSIFKNIIFGSSSFRTSYLPAPRTRKPKARTLFNQFSNHETDVILKLCKDNEVTVNSFLIAAANIALLKIAEVKSSKMNIRRKINFYQAVNMRKYLEPQHQNTSGCRISNIEMQVKMSLSDATDFWTVTKKTHIDIKNKIDILEEPFKNRNLHLLDYNIVPMNKLLKTLGFSVLIPIPFYVSNMGNLESMLPSPNGSDNLKITNLLRSVNICNVGTNMLLAFHTFRGHHMFSMDYSTNSLLEEIAQEYMVTFMKNVRLLISNDNK